MVMVMIMITKPIVVEAVEEVDVEVEVGVKKVVEVIQNLLLLQILGRDVKYTYFFSVNE